MSITINGATNAVSSTGTIAVSAPVSISNDVTLGTASLTDLTTVPDQLALNYTTDVLPTMRPTLLLDFANSLTVDPRITFTRASTATYFDAAGVLSSAANNVPRIDYDPETLICKGLLIEEARTNLLTYSEQFDNAAWIKSNANISVTSTNSTSPDGTASADTVTISTGGRIVESFKVQPSSMILRRTRLAFLSNVLRQKQRFVLTCDLLVDQVLTTLAI